MDYYPCPKTLIREGIISCWGSRITPSRNRNFPIEQFVEKEIVVFGLIEEGTGVCK